MKKRAGQATPAFTFPFKATTCDCRLYIGNLRHIRQGLKGMIFFFPTATQWQKCPVLMATVAFAARRIGFFFQLGLKKETEQEIVVGKTVFGYWQRSARRHQTQIATAACALVMTTGKGHMFSNTLFLKNAVRNAN